MAAVITGEVLARLKIVSTNAVSSVISSPFTVDIPSGAAATTLANGSTAGTVSVGWADTRTLAVSTPVTLDLTSLAAASTNTGAAAFAKVVAIEIINNETADGGKDLIVGNAASNQFLFNTLSAATTTFTVKAGCSVLITDFSTAGMPCATAKNLKLDPSTNAISVTVAIIGR